MSSLTADTFVCTICGKRHKREALHLTAGGNGNMGSCVFCYAKEIERKAKPAGTLANIRRHAAKRYKAGKLPPWMFS